MQESFYLIENSQGIVYIRESIEEKDKQEAICRIAKCDKLTKIEIYNRKYSVHVREEGSIVKLAEYIFEVKDNLFYIANLTIFRIEQAYCIEAHLTHSGL